MSLTRYVRFHTAADPTPRWGMRRGDAVVELAGAPWTGAAELAHTHRSAEVRLLAPAAPTKILALAYNYKDLFEDAAARTSSREAHFSDPGFEPLVFLKGPNKLFCFSG